MHLGWHRCGGVTHKATAVQRGLPAVAALGVVFGDIGTSPLYTIRQAFGQGSPAVVDQSDLLGVCSLIIWSLVLVVSLKYVTVALRADHDGEGGILSLFSLIDRRRLGHRAAALVAVLGVFGTALLYGDGTITPAISVLSAVEGFVVAAAVIILVGPSCVRSRRCTERRGS